MDVAHFMAGYSFFLQFFASVSFPCCNSVGLFVEQCTTVELAWGTPLTVRFGAMAFVSPHTRAHHLVIPANSPFFVAVLFWRSC